MSESSPSQPLLSDSSYNFLKRAVTLVLPAVGALYFALAPLWHLPKSEEVVGTVAALNVFFGVVLSLSAKSYNSSDAKYSGTLNVKDFGNGAKGLEVALDNRSDLMTLDLKPEVTFRVNNVT